MMAISIMFAFIITIVLFIVLTVYQTVLMEYIGDMCKNRPEILFAIAAICFIIVAFIIKSMK
ncbi:MAG: hypothetical protein ABFC94_12990 [Syntrophomonas sp.]